MGGCGSVNNKESDSKMMTRLRLAFSLKNKQDLILISSPPLKTPSINLHPSITLGSHNPLPSLTGSKEESFFDSKAWLDSDDDDFLSVKGDFTPSQGNTPVHHNFSTGTPQVNKSLVFNDSSAEPSPNKKKRLSELFEESLREDKGVEFEDHSDNDNMTSTKVENKSTPLGLSSRSVNGSVMLKEKTVKSSQCCLPMMLSSRSFNERSKMSPAKCALGS